MAGGRRRKLTAEERALWRQVADSATPLRSTTAPAPEPSGPVTRTPSPAPRLPVALPRPAAPEPGRVTLDFAPELPDALARAHPHMDRRRFDRLTRGRMTPEARLDLHGMTSERAHSALIGFIASAHAQGLRLVLVITGKGRSTDDHGALARRHGVLRHALPHWLGASTVRSRILQIAPAHQRHGGGGAFYVYLRRQR